MKKIALALGLSLAFMAGNAQDGNNICVFNSMANYNGGGGPEELERGMKCSDEAAANEATISKPKTWFYRGQLYSLAFLDTVLRKKDNTTTFKASGAFKKLLDLNDPKFKDWDEVPKYLIPLANVTFNEGVKCYEEKNFAQAFKFFYSIRDINTVLTTKVKGSTGSGIADTTILKNSAYCAENSGDVASVIKVYQEWLAIAPSARGYSGYANALRKVGKSADATKVIDEAIVKFPKDASLLVDKINVYLADSNYTAALTYVNNLLEVEPKNDGALFIKGIAYEKIGNEDSVVYYYTKSSEANPKNIKPLNNLAALYVKKANELVEVMNKLGNTTADTKKYDELQKKQKDYYLKAKPFLVKAKEIDPTDTQISRTLKQVELKTAE